MALHNLKITVVNGGKSSGVSAVKGKSGGAEESKFYKVLNYNESLKTSTKGAVGAPTAFAIQSGINLATQTARQFINYYISDIGRRNGDSNYQSIVNRRIEQVTDTLGIGQAALAGGATGAMFGPVGAGIGAGIGAASSGINLHFKYAERERAYQHEMFKDSTNQAYNLARANFSALTGRVR